MATQKHSPLTYNVSQLLREESGSRREHAFTEPTLHLHEGEELRDIAGAARFTRTELGVYVDATASGIVSTTCMRCLQPAMVAVAVTIAEQYRATVDVATGASVASDHGESDDDDDAFIIDERHFLDIGLALREYAILEMPMRPLCKPDCLGLCAGCGVDLNQESCRCSESPVDERFAALQALLDRKPQQ
jgi:uncharacterized protein